MLLDTQQVDSEIKALTCFHSLQNQVSQAAVEYVDTLVIQSSFCRESCSEVWDITEARLAWRRLVTLVCI